MKKLWGIRVEEEIETAGLDVSEHGMWGYPEFYIPVPGGYDAWVHAALGAGATCGRRRSRPSRALNRRAGGSVVGSAGRGRNVRRPSRARPFPASQRTRRASSSSTAAGSSPRAASST